MARFILTENLTIPSGTIFETTDRLGDGGLECESNSFHDRLMLRVFLSERLGLEAGSLARTGDKPMLRAVN